jgi:probable HAF family extracellular repeat protein
MAGDVICEYSFSTHIMSFSGGVMHDLGTLPGFPNSTVYDLNNSGDIVGYSETANGLNAHAFLYHNGSLLDMNSLMPSNSSGTVSEAFAINNRGQVLCYVSGGLAGEGLSLYNNGSFAALNDLLLDSGSWRVGAFGDEIGYKARVLNDAGQVACDAADSNNTDHLVILTPAIEFVREKTPGCGWYVPVTNGLPIFQPDSGVGEGESPMPSGITAIGLILQANLSNNEVGGMYMSAENSVGSFSGLLRETAPASGVFTNSDGSFTVTMSPGVQTSSNQINFLDMTVTSASLGLTNLPAVVQETDTNSLKFANVIPHAELYLTGPLVSNTVNTINLQLDTSWDPNDFDGPMTETAPNSMVFTCATGDVTLTIDSFTGLSFTQQDVVVVTVNNTILTATNFTLTLTETTTNSMEFSNFGTPQPSNLVPATPATSGEGVFYVQTYGSSTVTNPINVTLSNSVDQVTVPAPWVSGNTYRTSKIVLLPAGATDTYSGITVLHMADPIVTARSLNVPLSVSQTPVSKRAFIGRAIPNGEMPTETLSEMLSNGWLSVSADNHLNNLESVLVTNLGYAVTKVQRLTVAQVTGQVASNSVWYCLAHGATQHSGIAEPFLGFNVYSNMTSGGERTILPADISANIGGNSNKLVFVNGCMSADEDSQAPQQFQQAFQTQVYVGWLHVERMDTAAESAAPFFLALEGGRTVQSALDTVGNTDLTALGNRSQTISLVP